MRMNNQEIIISGVHLELTDAIRNIVHDKMLKLFKHEENIVRIRVELISHPTGTTRNEFTARGIITIHGPDIVVGSTSEDLYKSVDELVNKLDRKLRRRARLSKVKRKDVHGVDLPASLPKMGIA